MIYLRLPACLLTVSPCCPQGDVKLLHHLRDLSSSIIARTRGVADAVDDLETAAAKADVVSMPLLHEHARDMCGKFACLLG